jgi:AcrR family transcriptional regulator
MSEIKKPERRSLLSHGKAKHVSSSIRERVLKAAFTLFREHGFSSTSMLDIVTRARVSKRDLYALFNNKHAVLADMHQRTRPTDASAIGYRDSRAADPGCASQVARRARRINLEDGVPPGSADRFSARDCRIRSRPRDRSNTR